jgi:N-acetylneuraminate synthase
MHYNAINRNVFEELFVLEAPAPGARGLEGLLTVVQDFGRVVRYNNMRTAIKLSLRDAGTFVHKQFRERTDIPYVRTAVEGGLPREAYVTLCEAVRRHGCIRMATPYDEKSVQLCVELGIEILKIGSSDANDWPLIDRIASTRKPVIASTGGNSLKDMDDLVTFFTNRNIPLALNHCVSLFPTRDLEMELNQIDFMRERYPEITIGLSTHENPSQTASLLIAYAKGARTFERHIGLAGPETLPPHCATPEQIDHWFKAFKKAKEMCGAPGTQKRIPPEREIQYLDSLVRGIYAARDLPAGLILTGEDIYMSIPLQRGQISCRELITEDRLTRPVKAHEPITIDHLDNLYSVNPELREMILQRGL